MSGILFHLCYEMKTVIIIINLLFYFNITCFAQADSLSFQFYAEGYATYTSNKPESKQRPAFFYNHTKANNAGVNLALAKLHYSSKRFRSNIGFMAGDYANANLANEEKWARIIYEANAGVLLSKKYPVWLDAGVMPSHIGFESVIGKDNRTATRSITADNSPYYETGLRVSYKPTPEWYLALLMLTGWQRITVPANQLGTHWGMQINYTPNEKLSFNHSSFIGKVFYGRNVTRIYSNTSATFGFGERTGLTIGWDVGLQENAFDANRTDTWSGLQALLHYQIVPGKWNAAIRYERFVDKKNLLFQLPADIYHQFYVHHASFNLDWQPLKQMQLRAEANYLQSPYSLFFKETRLTKSQLTLFLIASYNLQFTGKTKH